MREILNHVETNCKMATDVKRPMHHARLYNVIQQLMPVTDAALMIHS
jgi:hypothetical protein